MPAERTLEVDVGFHVHRPGAHRDAIPEGVASRGTGTGGAAARFTFMPTMLRARRLPGFGPAVRASPCLLVLVGRTHMRSRLTGQTIEDLSVLSPATPGYDLVTACQSCWRMACTVVQARVASCRLKRVSGSLRSWPEISRIR